jgi:3-mercaptopyruvate sulfurtransferase SseA
VREASRVVVYDGHGNVVAAVVLLDEAGGNHHIFSTQAGDEDFQERLRDLGIDRTITVVGLKVK